PLHIDRLRILLYPHRAPLLVRGTVLIDLAVVRTAPDFHVESRDLAEVHDTERSRSAPERIAKRYTPRHACIKVHAGIALALRAPRFLHRTLPRRIKLSAPDAVHVQRVAMISTTTLAAADFHFHRCDVCQIKIS